MTKDRPLHLVNLSTGEVIAPLSDAQVKALTTFFEKESRADTSFFITPEAIEFLCSRGAEELADLLATALGDTHGLPVGYAPVGKTGSYRAHGRVLALESNSPLTGYKLEVFDEDITADDLLGWCYSDPQGRFDFRFEQSEFKDSRIEGQPELELRISDIDGVALGWVGILRERDADFHDIFISADGKVVAPVGYPGAAAVCPTCGALFRVGPTHCDEDQTPLRPLGYVVAT
jgi:hypothetical protein